MNPHNQNQSADPPRHQEVSDHLLDAFRYVAGELSATEADLLEIRMLDDQTLCEAVLQATQLSLSIASCDESGVSDKSPMPTARTTSGAQLASVQIVDAADAGMNPSTRSSRLAAVALSVACCLCLAFGVRWQNAEPLPTELAGDVPEQAELLVTAWADSFAADPVEEFNETLTTELAVPDWMFAAIDTADVPADTERSEHHGDSFRNGEMEL